MLDVDLQDELWRDLEELGVLAGGRQHQRQHVERREFRLPAQLHHHLQRKAVVAIIIIIIIIIIVVGIIIVAIIIIIVVVVVAIA